MVADVQYRKRGHFILTASGKLPQSYSTPNTISVVQRHSWASSNIADSGQFPYVFPIMTEFHCRASFIQSTSSVEIMENGRSFDQGKFTTTIFATCTVPCVIWPEHVILFMYSARWLISHLYGESKTNFHWLVTYDLAFGTAHLLLPWFFHGKLGLLVSYVICLYSAYSCALLQFSRQL